MELKQNKLRLFATTSILTFMGMLNLMMLLFDCYGSAEGIRMSTGIILSLLMSSGFSFLFTFVRKKWIVWIVCAAVLGIVFWVAREAVMGGTAVYINSVINEIALYFDTEMYFIDIPRRLVREADEKLAIIMMMTVFAAVYSFCISYRKTTFVPFITSLAFTVLAMVLEVGTAPRYIFGIAYCVALAIIIMSAWNKSLGKGNLFYVHIAAAAIGVFLFAVSMIVSSFKPEEQYRKPEYFDNVYKQGENIYNQFMNGELTLNRVIDFFAELIPAENMPDSIGIGIASGAAGEIGAGELGRVDSLEFSGKEVLQVKMPKVDGYVYLKGYIGETYSPTGWYEPVWNEDKQELANQGIYSQNISYENLFNLAQNGGIDGYMTEMTVNYTAGNQRYFFAPLYPRVNTALWEEEQGEGYEGDNPYTVSFLHIDEEELPYIDRIYNGSHEDFMGIAYPAIQSEEQYRYIAYRDYLDVNTTDSMAEMFNEQWGGRDISSAAARYSVACDIRKYLSDNCTYNLSPGAVPDGEDFVEYFITKSHEGYCTYFATSAVMMLRSAGIPARYVEGYFFSTSGAAELDEYGQYTEYRENNLNSPSSYQKKLVNVSVRDSSAHAWVEYYVDGVGWVDFEVTPGNYTQRTETQTTEETTAQETTAQETGPQETNERETTAPVTRETLTTGNSSGGSNSSFRIKLSKTAERALIAAAAAVVLIAVTVVFFAMRHKKVAIIRDRMYNGSDEALFPRNIVMIYNEYIRLARHFGFKRDKDMSERAFAEKLSSECPFVSGQEAEEMAALYEKAVFSEENILRKDRDKAAAIMRTVRMRMYGHTGAFKRFAYRYIMNI